MTLLYSIQLLFNQMLIHIHVSLKKLVPTFYSGSSTIGSTSLSLEVWLPGALRQHSKTKLYKLFSCFARRSITTEAHSAAHLLYKASKSLSLFFSGFSFISFNSVWLIKSFWNDIGQSNYKLHLYFDQLRVPAEKFFF